MRFRCKKIILLFTLFVLLFTLPTFAHKVNIVAYIIEGTVYTKSSFSDGKKVKNGIVEVYDSLGNKLLEGVTDEEGSFKFKIPKRDNLKIILIAPLGHRASYILSMDEVKKKDEVEKKEEVKKEERFKGLVVVKKIILGILCIFGIFWIVLFFKRRRLNAH